MVLSETAEQLRDAIKAEAHWQVVIHPTSFKQDRIPTLKDLWKSMEECSVHLRGWDYPHVDHENRGNGSDWISGWCDFAGEREYWKLFQSGQFAHVFAFNEDSRPEALKFALQKVRDLPPGANPSGVIDVVELLFKTTEIFEFSARLAQKLKLDSPISLKIGLVGIGGRLLTKERAPFWKSPYLASQPYLEYPREIPLDALIGDTSNLAIECALWFFERFGWFDPPIAKLKSDQHKLLTRTF